WFIFRRPLRSTRFPYTTLFRSGQLIFANDKYRALLHLTPAQLSGLQHTQLCPTGLVQTPAYDAMWQSLCAGNEFSGVVERVRSEDRKSTRLNSSHVKISYAVFC